MKPRIQYGVTIDLNGDAVRAPVSVAGKRWSTPDKRRALAEMVKLAEKSPRFVVITVKKQRRAVDTLKYEGISEQMPNGTKAWRIAKGGEGYSTLGIASWLASRAGKRVRITLEELGEAGT